MKRGDNWRSTKPAIIDYKRKKKPDATKTSEEVAAETEVFLANGGVIQIIEPAGGFKNTRYDGSIYQPAAVPSRPPGTTRNG